MTPSSSGESTQSSETQKTPSSNQEPDLSALLGLDVNGTLTLAGMKAAGLTLNKISSKVIIANGQAKLAPLTANLYQGEITVNAMVDHAKGRNKYQVTKKISGIQILPLMKDLTQLEIVSGATELNVSARGAGLSPHKIKRGLIATGDFKISDGALYGINIPQKIRSAKAAFGGKSSGATNESQQTDFSSLTGKFKISQGIFNNTNLSMLSPLIRLKGAGTANIIKELIDYKLGVTVVASLEGQGGANDDQLKGVTIPLKVTGSFSEPKFGRAPSGALKSKFDAEKKRLEQKVKDQLKEKYEDKLREKLKGKLGGLFG
jgi:AsmA protein